jgi:nucleoside-diphosphate-sugar epimerase
LRSLKEEASEDSLRKTEEGYGKGEYMSVRSGGEIKESPMPTASSIVKYGRTPPRRRRSYMYGDVVDAILFVAERAENDDFNMGTGIETTVEELAERIWRLCGRKEPLKLSHLPGLKYDAQRRVPDISKISRLGWMPKAGLDEGLRRTMEWIRLEI